MAELLRQCIISLRRRPAGTVLTSMSIAVGVCSVILISTLGSTGAELIDSEMTQLGLDGVVITADSKITDLRLTGREVEAVKGERAVKSAAGLSLETAKIRMHGLISNTVVWGLSDQYDQVMNLRLCHGRSISGQDLSCNSPVCMIDLHSAQQFYQRTNVTGKKLLLDFAGQTQELTVIGVVEVGGNSVQGLIGEYAPSFLYVPAGLLEQSSGKSGYSQITVRMKGEDPDHCILEDLEKSVERASGHKNVYLLQDLSEQNSRLKGVLDTVRKSLSMVAGISLIVAAIGTMTVMSAAVKERTREIGIKKSIGASDMRIMMEFLTESVLISAAGAAAGSTAALILLKAAALLFPQYVPVISGIWTSTAVCIILGTLFGMIPARQAARLDPIDALRSES